MRNSSDKKTEAIKYLEEHAELLDEIKSLRQEIADMEDTATCIGSATDYSEVRVMTSGRLGARYEDIVAEIEQLRLKLAEKTARAAEQKREIRQIILFMSSPRYTPKKNGSLRTVMRYRYLSGLMINEIAKKMNYSGEDGQGYIYQLHMQAKEVFAETYELLKVSNAP